MNTAWVRFKNLISLLVVGLAGPCLAGIYFESSWNMATGNSELALTDGYRFTQTAGTNLLKVETGGIAGNNLMGIWLNDQQFAHTMVSQLPVMDYPDFYYRFYIRVYPRTGIRYPNYHGIENLDYNEASNFYLSVRDLGDPNSWGAAVGSYAEQKEGMDNGYLHGGLAMNVWYRVEGRIHWYSHADWAAPTKWEFKIYDGNNNVVVDERSMYGTTTGATLQSHYDQGKRLFCNGKTATWAMGNNGPAGGTGQGRIHDVSCFALGNDASVWGPVTAKLPADNIKPQASNFFPAQNATNVAAGTPITLVLKDQGFGLDTSSLSVKVNGAIVKFTRSGSIWNSQIFHKPTQSFAPGSKVSVEINAKDLASPAKVMVPVTYSFTVAGTPGINPSRTVLKTLGGSVGQRQNVYNLFGQREISFENGSAVGGSQCLFVVVPDGKSKAKKLLTLR